MAKPTDLIDPFFRTALVEAEQALDAGDYLGTVRKCVEVYSRIAAQQPEMVLRPPNQLMPLPRARSVREGRRNALTPWPVRLGVGISFDESEPALGGQGIFDYVTNAMSKDAYSIGGQVWIQAQAIGTTIIWSAVVSLVAYKLVDLTVGLRVPEDQEREGLDITSHGETAYHA